MESLLCHHNVILNMAPRNESHLVGTNHTRQQVSKPLHDNFANGFICGISESNRYNLGHVKGAWNFRY